MIKEFCDLCGCYIDAGKECLVNHRRAPSIEGRAKYGSWVVTVKAVHTIGHSVGGIVCLKCMESVEKAGNEAATYLVEIIEGLREPHAKSELPNG